MLMFIPVYFLSGTLRDALSLYSQLALQQIFLQQLSDVGGPPHRSGGHHSIMMLPDASLQRCRQWFAQFAPNTGSTRHPTNVPQGGTCARTTRPRVASAHFPATW